MKYNCVFVVVERGTLLPRHRRSFLAVALCTDATAAVAVDRSFLVVALCAAAAVAERSFPAVAVPSLSLRALGIAADTVVAITVVRFFLVGRCRSFDFLPRLTCRCPSLC